jgi:hypothetical protein
MLVLAVVGIFLLACAVPILAGFSSPIGLVIIGIALYQGWKMNRRPALAIVGPLRVGDTTPAAGAEGG